MDALAGMFAEVIRPQDRLLLLPVYDAGGTADRSINSDALVARLGDRAVAVSDFEEAYSWCRAHSGDFAAFAVCGARDPGLAPFARRLASLKVEKLKG